MRNQQRYLLIGVLIAVMIPVAWKVIPRFLAVANSPSGPVPKETIATVVPDKSEEADDKGYIVFPKDSWSAAGLATQAVTTESFTVKIELTGKVTLNEDRVSHIFPLVDGRVDEVKVQFGQRVRKDDLLLVVQSKEVGQAKLKLFQNRMQLEFAATRNQWIQSVADNTKLLLNLIRSRAEITDIEAQLKDRPLGEYRDRLMTAYIDNYRAEKNLERLGPLAKDGVVAGKQMLEAESGSKAARATLQSLVEQIAQDSQQAAIVSAQTMRELQTSVSVDETNLKILGFKDEDLVSIDPEHEGQTIAHYPIVAPFDGTVISKDAVLLERVGPERQILSIADLSTVWITTDIYEEHLPLLNHLDDKTIYLRSNAWPGKTFEATIFYTGDVVNEASRTVSMRALADNKDGHLKPGMFLTVEFPDVAQTKVVQVPEAAVLDFEGKSFVFVHVEGDNFERRDVNTGRRNENSIEILSGLKEGEVVVRSGGFALKSQMLSELLSE